MHGRKLGGSASRVAHVVQYGCNYYLDGEKNAAS